MLSALENQAVLLASCACVILTINVTSPAQDPHTAVQQVEVAEATSMEPEMDLESVKSAEEVPPPPGRAGKSGISQGRTMGPAFFPPRF